MSEPIPACISIGGKLPSKLVPQLCAAINTDRVSLEWGDALFRPQTAEELLDACDEHQGIKVLWLCAEHADWGRLPALEAFLVREARLPFDLLTDAKLGVDPEQVTYRPGRRPVRFTTTAHGDPVISAQLLAPIVKMLAKASSAQQKQAYQAGAKRALKRLQAVLPPAITPLPPFEIG
jgi:hypothetical protein